MPLFKIYAGLGGGFGGANYIRTEEFETLEQAESAAYEEACEKYDSYDGSHGLTSWQDCYEEAQNENPDADEDTLNTWAEQAYNEERESWLDYYVKEVTDNK